MLALALILWASAVVAQPEPPEPLPAEEILGAGVIPAPIDLAAPARDMWTRIRNGFAMPNLESALVLRHQQYYQSHPDYLRRMVERSRPYLHYIVELLEARGMPTELALLPMVESAYNPMAQSPAQASGLWQFIPSTGRSFGLEQDWWRDQRRDIVASTVAALDYLQYVYDMHGDWHLALASYNWGEGVVGRMLARNRARRLPADYASINMPAETRHYVPKLQALKNIFGNPRLVASLELPVLPNQPYFQTLALEQPIDFSLAARIARMDPVDFLALNPAHNRPVIPSRSPLVIPADRLDDFRMTLARHDAPLSSWGIHALAAGETLEQVATRGNIRLEDLRKVNGLTPGSRLPPGFVMLAPLAALSEPEMIDADDVLLLSRQHGNATAIQGAAAITHVVKRGDTLSGISRRYRMSVAALKRLNPKAARRLRPGIRLVVRQFRRVMAQSVAEHPTLFALPQQQMAARLPPPASRAAAYALFNTNEDDEEEAMAEAEMDADTEGGIDNAPAHAPVVAQPASPAVQPAVAAAAALRRHIIQRGDTLFSIARRYRISIDVLKRINRLTNSQLLPGRVLAIPPGNG